MVPSHKINNQTWKLFACVLPGLLGWAEAKARSHTREPVWGTDCTGQRGNSETGKDRRPVLLLSRFCYQAGHLCGQSGCDLAGSPKKAVDPQSWLQGQKKGDLFTGSSLPLVKGFPVGCWLPHIFPSAEASGTAQPPHTGSRETLGWHARLWYSGGRWLRLYLCTAGSLSNIWSEEVGQEDVHWGNRGAQYIQNTSTHAHVCV